MVLVTRLGTTYQLFLTKKRKVMGIQEMFVCDNDCGTIAPPDEGLVPINKRNPVIPYLWWQAEVMCQGPGPVVRIMTCSLHCLVEALTPMVELARREQE